MSIDEAIKHLKEKAEDNKKYAQECEECAKRKIDKMMGLDKIHRRVMQSCIKCIEEQEQLAEWLEELKEARKGFEENRKAGYSHGYSDGYNKAIDEFAERLKEKILEEIDDVSESQRNYEVGSDMSLTCSHIMGTLRDVYHRVIDEITEEMKEGGV